MFNVTGSNLTGSGGTVGFFNNFGTFSKAAGTAATTIDFVFNNSATVTVAANGGTLTFRDGGSSSGSFTGGTGTLLKLGDTETTASTR